MQLTELFEDDDAVSPVIGVILMVAITVILAAVIGTFVLGLGEQVGNAQPTTTFDFDYEEEIAAGDVPSVGCELDDTDGASGISATSDLLTIAHNGGNDVTASQLDVQDDNGDSSQWGGGTDPCSGTGASSDVTTGDNAFAEVEGSSTVQVIWTASGGGDSAPLGNWEGPNA